MCNQALDALILGNLSREESLTGIMQGICGWLNPHITKEIERDDPRDFVHQIYWSIFPFGKDNNS